MNIEPDKFFGALANDVRLRCAVLLAHQGELCVCELTHALGMSQPKVSRHLATLRELGMVLDRRDGLWIYYRLHPDLPEWMTHLVESAARAVADLSPFADDRAALENMPNRPETPRCANDA